MDEFVLYMASVRTFVTVWDTGNGIWGTAKLKNPKSKVMGFIITHLEVMGFYITGDIGAARYVGFSVSVALKPPTTHGPLS